MRVMLVLLLVGVHVIRFICCIDGYRTSIEIEHTLSATLIGAWANACGCIEREEYLDSGSSRGSERVRDAPSIR